MIGDKFETYNDYLKSVEGYTENETINSENYVPSSKADKNFFLTFEKKEREPMSGDMEKAIIFLTLKVIYKYPTKNDLSGNHKNTWNAMGKLERGLLNFAISDGNVIFMDTVGLEPIPSSDFWLATFTGRLIYHRSLANE